MGGELRRDSRLILDGRREDGDRCTADGKTNSTGRPTGNEESQEAARTALGAVRVVCVLVGGGLWVWMYLCTVRGTEVATQVQYLVQRALVVTASSEVRGTVPAHTSYCTSHDNTMRSVPGAGTSVPSVDTQGSARSQKGVPLAGRPAASHRSCPPPPLPSLPPRPALFS